MSVAQVLEIVPAEDSWVNDGFTAVVRSIKNSPANASKKFWKCVLADTTGSATINMTVFTAPKFAEGDQIDVLGNGIKRKEYNGTAEVSIGKQTEIHVLGQRVRDQAPGSTAAAGAAAGAQHHEPTGHGAGDFHKAMKRQALLYLHCLDYGQQIATKHHNGTGFEMTPDQRQACVSSLYIEANRKGLDSIVPAMGTATAATQRTPERKVEPPPPRRTGPTDEQLANRTSDLDEDVPF